MSESIFFGVPSSAIRVFVGFRHPDLDTGRFLTALGQTFMPGTPYMLRPLGLAAYVPGVIKDEAGSPCPHEVALIAWPSPEVQRRATRETLRGRVYTQSHGGVYDSRSRAQFPVPLAGFDAVAGGPFYLFDGDTDWQLGSYVLFAGVKMDGTLTGEAFRKAIHARIAEALRLFSAHGVDQCIVAAADDYVIAWIHYEQEPEVPLNMSSLLTGLIRPTADVKGVRVICREEPPTVELSGTHALNFIFLRHGSAFLR